MVTSPWACGWLFGATRWMSLVKNSSTSGLASSRAALAEISPYIRYLSGLLSGLWRPDFGTACRPSTKGLISSTLVSATRRNVSPVRGSGTSLTLPGMIHDPPTKFKASAGLPGCMLFGSTVAQDPKSLTPAMPMAEAGEEAAPIEASERRKPAAVDCKHRRAPAFAREAARMATIAWDGPLLLREGVWDNGGSPVGPRRCSLPLRARQVSDRSANRKR
mmetsp:Transcript_22759/g.63200  ORF Transcript_22759/g.63200 Transcript_22759/m.63200 type:complete len:219 (+) Transcript_22759:1763-2419(+)